MIMHDEIFFPTCDDVPLQNAISHLECYTIETSWNMHECNGFKMSKQISSAHEISKETRITYLIAVIQLGDKQLGVEEDIKVTNTQVEGSVQDTKDTIIPSLVVGSNTNTHSINMDQIM